ncbi:MAG: peptide deformylase [Clostridia bacterium]|nr:peptide deformylase [Clostridia bacterium]MBQ9407910.1 peptide deformylase [Clostridia bacterium]
MATRRILREGDETLRKISRPVKEIDKHTKQLLDDMAETMYAAEGVGLAAPQVGVLRRVVVIDVGEGLLELINPEIIKTEGSMINPEGCLSIPGRRCTVQRPQKVWVRYLNRKNKQCEIEGEGLLAMALCHEIDHLDGILYIDKMIEDVTNKGEEAK